MREIYVHSTMLTAIHLPTFQYTKYNVQYLLYFIFILILHLEIVGINADVWKKIADNLSVGLTDKVTPGSVRMRVCRDGGKLLEVLGLVLSSKSSNTDGHYNIDSESISKYKFVYLPY